MSEVDAGGKEEKNSSSPGDPEGAEKWERSLRHDGPAGLSPRRGLSQFAFPPRLWVSGRGLLFLLSLLLICAVMAFAIWQPIKVLPRIALAPGYALIDQAGKPFNSEALRGKLTLYTVTDSQCNDPCVPTSATLAEIERSLRSTLTSGPTGESVGEIPLHFVALYVEPDPVDPAADHLEKSDAETVTPASLQREAQRLGVDAQRWHLLTGAPSQLKQVIGSGFSSYYGPADAWVQKGEVQKRETQGESATFEVAPLFVLVDGWGIIRAYYRSAHPDIEIIQRDLGLIVQEVRQSRGVTRYAYEAAHLFLCYPK